MAEHIAERVLMMLVDRNVERVIAGVGRAASSVIDRFAAGWLMARIELPRELALELLEHLGERVGAKIEVSDPLDP